MMGLFIALRAEACDMAHLLSPLSSITAQFSSKACSRILKFGFGKPKTLLADGLWFVCRRNAKLN